MYIKDFGSDLMYNKLLKICKLLTFIIFLHTKALSKLVCM